MGNSVSVKANDKHLQTIGEYKKLKNIDDPRFGRVSILEHKITRELAVFKEINSEYDSNIREALIRLEARGQMHNGNLLKLISKDRLA